MKALKYSVPHILIWLYLINPVYSQFRLISPNGGEKLASGAYEQIRWEGSEGEVNLEYSSDNGNKWKLIDSNIRGVSYQWTVPQEANSQSLIRIFSNSVPNAKKGVWDWTIGKGNSITDIVNDSKVDSSGNIYVCGSFRNTIDFGNGDTLSAGNMEIFVAKYNTSGELVWVRKAGGYGHEAATSITIDNKGNLFICGYFNDTIDFGNEVILKTTGKNDVFLAKYGAENGQIQWAKQSKGSNDEYATIVEADSKGNIYVCGALSSLDTADFGNGVTSIKYGYFLVKYDNNGNALKIAKMNIGYDFGYYEHNQKDLVIDKIGNIYLCGGFYDWMNFGSSIGITASGASAFIAKFDSNCNITWAKTTRSGEPDLASSLAVDNDGRIYVCGYFRDTIEFSPKVKLRATGKFSFREYDGFLLCYDPAGEPLWAKAIGGDDVDKSRFIALDSTGIYVGGEFKIAIDFKRKIKLRSWGEIDVFIAKFTKRGNVLWAQGIGGSKFDEVSSMEIDHFGNTYIAGQFNSKSIFDSTHVLLSPSYSFFLAKYRNDTEAKDYDDTSDAVWSIVKPRSEYKIINMGNAVIGEKKDSLIRGMIRNTGDYPVRVDYIRIEGEHANDFSFTPVNTPFSVPAHSDFDLRVQFQPLDTGMRKASFYISTQINVGVPPLTGQASILDKPKSLRITSILNNPIRGIIPINFELPSEMEAEITITDEKGAQISIEKKVFKGGENSININTLQFSIGMYIIAIKTSNDLATQKIIVER